ncbi:MAG: hypothetical protein K1X57_20275 [Gemmataceae bacterium]|nr:hypothetical protein [Gemmataceae bacterium]
MFLRVIFAGLLGGAMIFAGGFIDHMLLNWVGRHMKHPAEEATLPDALKKHFPEAGAYGYPHPPKGAENLKGEDYKRAFEATAAEYKKGPAAWVIVPPAGQAMMSGEMLGMEFASNVIAALLAAIVVATTRPSIGFVGRFLVVVLIGLITWFSVNASYHIWYRFPLPWVQDELYCAAMEWAMAGVLIAAIVRPRVDTGF